LTLHFFHLFVVCHSVVFFIKLAMVNDILADNDVCVYICVISDCGEIDALLVKSPNFLVIISQSFGAE